MHTLLDDIDTLGRYKIIRELGRGGMSIVYLAQDTELDREVAIKCVDTQNVNTARMADRLRCEAKLLAQLNHPNIVQLYDVIEQGDILGLVIEYVGGDTLTNRLKQAPTKEVKLKWLAEVAQGLASAHQKGIAHCDLKADNILITQDNVAKIADFGIARIKLDDYLEDDGLTRMDSVTGSYFSLSPEQASGQAVDTRTDLFSLGVLIYQVSLGKHPYGETNNKAVLVQRIINTPFELTEAITHALGVRLAEVVKSLLSKQPQDRLYSAAEVVELVRSSSLINSHSDTMDHTVEIPIQQQQPKFEAQSLIRSGWVMRATLISVGFIIGILILKLIPSAPTSANISYIALDTVEVTATKDFNPTHLILIKSALQQSAESTVLSFSETGLVDARELNSIEGNFSKKATAAGVKDILVVAANCLQQKCDIKIQRRSGERMAVSHQANFPVASDSLVGLTSAIASQIPKLFDQSSSRQKTTVDLSENEYRDYLEIYTASNSGVSIDQKHFEEAIDFINAKPNFLPSYALLHGLGSFLFRNTNDKSYLNTVADIFNTAPRNIKFENIYKRTKIMLLLDLEKLGEAKMAYEELKEDVTDKLFLSEIESSIAYSESDYEKLLTLDRQNAIWKPSIANLYNLATSEFLVGNHAQAKQALASLFQINPSDTYALDLKASIEMSLGNLPDAIETYEALLTQHQSSAIFSNYGIALALNKDYGNAITQHKKAIKINPNTPQFYLNLADAQSLSGKTEPANINYQQVITLLQAPKSASEFSWLAQAYVQLGQHSKAVKTLKTANKQFPNVAELDYAASIINTLSGNHIAAAVDIIDAIEGGTAPIWFSFNWFKPLCDNKDFIDITGAATKPLCN